MNSRPKLPPGVSRFQTNISGGRRRRPSADQPARRPHSLELADQLHPVLRHPQVADGEDDADRDGDQCAEQEGAAAGVLRRLVDAAREEVADQDVGARPDSRAEDAVRHEAAVSHARTAGDERRQRPHQADEAADQDRLAAMAAEVVLDLLEALVGDPHARAVLEDEAAAEPPADEEAHAVPGPGGEPGDRDQQVDVDRTLARDGTAEQHHGLTRDHEADAGAGLEEGEGADEEVGPGAERVGDVLQHLLQVVVRDQPADQVVAGDHGGGDQRDREALAAAAFRKPQGPGPPSQTIVPSRSIPSAARTAAARSAKSPKTVGPEPVTPASSAPAA